MNFAKLWFVRTCCVIGSIALLAGCELPPTAMSNDASADQRRAAIDRLVKFAIEGDVGNAAETARFFDSNFILVEQFASPFDGDVYERFKIHQNGEKVFSYDSRYSLTWKTGGKLKRAMLTLELRSSVCLPPDEVRAAIPARYLQGERSGKFITIDEPKERGKNSSEFRFTDDETCLKNVTFIK